NALGGDDAITVEGIPRGVTVTVNGGTGNDTLQVGSAASGLTSFLGYSGTINFNGDAGVDLFRTWAVPATGRRTHAVFATVFALSDSTLRVNYATTESLVVNTGSGTSITDVVSTAAGCPVTVNGGPATDSVIAGGPLVTGTLNLFGSALTFNGGGGSDGLGVN